MEFLNDVALKIAAASSGRPNQALAVSKYQQLAPLILQAGGNPKAVLEEGAKLLTEGLDLTKFFPNPMAMMQAQPQQGQLPSTQQNNIQTDVATPMSLPGQ